LSTIASIGAKTRAARASARPVVSPLRIPEKSLGHLSQIFQMLGDASRLKILMALGHNGEMHVSALCDLLTQSQPAVSHHLRLLRMWGLVSFRRDGKHNYYRVDGEFLGDLVDQLFRDSGNTAGQIEFADFRLAYSRK
jgi:ArsR family transcriptional regulator